MPAHNKNKQTPFPPPAPCVNDQCGICELTVTPTDKAILCNKCNKCGGCDKIVANHHRAIECNMSQMDVICLKWIHIKCNKFSDKEYRTYQENSENIFFCINCMADSI